MYIYMQFEETEDMSENYHYDDEYSTVLDKKNSKKIWVKFYFNVSNRI